MNRLARWPWRRAGIALGIGLMGDLLWTTLWFPASVRDRIQSAESLPSLAAPVLVLGAGVLPDREPTQVLQGRLSTALALQRTGKASWFLVSGDNRSPYYNEPQAMRKWLQKQGVPLELIVADFAGRRTYDSLRRAQVVFGIRRVVVVTSDFHLPRALFTARHLGLDAWGVAASTEPHGAWAKVGFWTREYIARHRAILDAWFPPDTVLGPREPTPDDWAPTHGAPL